MKASKHPCLCAPVGVKYSVGWEVKKSEIHWGIKYFLKIEWGDYFFLDFHWGDEILSAIFCLT